MKITKNRILLSIAIFMGMSAASYSQQMKTEFSDSAFILKNIKDNRMEMQLSQLGADNGDGTVRKIGRQMLFDHDKMLNELTDVAKKKNIKQGDIDGSATANYAPTGADEANTPANISTDTSVVAVSPGTTTGSGTTGSTGATGMSSSSTGNNSTGVSQSTVVAIPTLNDLANATGAEFSKMWIQHMTAMHQAKLSELQAASKIITDADLLAAVNKAIPKIQTHLDMLTKATNGGK